MQQPPPASDSGTTNELRSDAKHIGSSAANFLHSEADARKGAVADQARSASSAIQHAAGELQDGAPAWLKSTLQQGADQIQRLAETLEQKDTRQIVEEVQSFARERPAIFLGACAAAGFAAARIFKAGAQTSSAENRPGSSGSNVPAFPQEFTPSSVEGRTQGEYA